MSACDRTCSRRSPPPELNADRCAAVIFSTPVAIVAAVLGKTSGACLAFGLVRVLAACGLRSLASALPSGGGWLAQLGLERELQLRPLQTLCIIRASPIPSALKSYALGLTEVRLHTFALACVVVNTPYSIGWAFAGSSASSLQEASSSDAARGVVGRVAVCLAALLGMSLVAKRARTRMKAAE